MVHALGFGVLDLEEEIRKIIWQEAGIEALPLPTTTP